MHGKDIKVDVIRFLSICQKIPQTVKGYLGQTRRAFWLAVFYWNQLTGDFLSNGSSFFSEIYWQMCAQVANITLIKVDISYIYIL